MVTKVDIRNWLYKCKAKALGSIIDAHINELEKSIATNDKLRNIHDAYVSYEKSVKDINQLFADNGCPDTKVYYSYANGFYSNVYIYNKGASHVVGYIISKNAEKFPKEHSMYEDVSKRHKEVSDEYTSLIRKCDEMKPKVAISYLVEIGFDVTSLTEIKLDVDKSKLFVCGDNKPS